MQNSQPCKILFLEPDTQEIELMIIELHRLNIHFIHKQASSKLEFIQELNDFKPELIIASNLLSNFNGKDAFALTKEYNSPFKFILIVETIEIEEEQELDYIKEGIIDLLTKTSYHRLPIMIMKCMTSKSSNENIKIDNQRLSFHIINSPLGLIE